MKGELEVAGGALGTHIIKITYKLLVLIFFYTDNKDLGVKMYINT
jgi:hypothetical protein